MSNSSSVVIYAFLFRLILLVYGELQDSWWPKLKFTDIDYFVFTDAARFVHYGVSPYLRSTYRYTPLLSTILVPNITFISVYGKLIFIFVDVLTGAVILKITRKRVNEHTALWWTSSAWFFNPFIASISARGNAESLLCFLTTLLIHAVECRWDCLAGVIFGLAVHLKIYPILYSLPIVAFLGYSGKASSSCSLYSYRGFKFALTSGASFLALSWIMFQRCVKSCIMNRNFISTFMFE